MVIDTEFLLKHKNKFRSFSYTVFEYLEWTLIMGLIMAVLSMPNTNIYVFQGALLSLMVVAFFIKAMFDSLECMKLFTSKSFTGLREGVALSAALFLTVIVLEFAFEIALVISQIELGPPLFNGKIY